MSTSEINPSRSALPVSMTRIWTTTDVYVATAPWDGADWPTGGPELDEGAELSTPIEVRAAGGVRQTVNHQSSGERRDVLHWRARHRRGRQGGTHELRGERDASRDVHSERAEGRSRRSAVLHGWRGSLLVVGARRGGHGHGAPSRNRCCRSRAPRRVAGRSGGSAGRGRVDTGVVATRPEPGPRRLRAAVWGDQPGRRLLGGAVLGESHQPGAGRVRAPVLSRGRDRLRHRVLPREGLHRGRRPHAVQGFGRADLVAAVDRRDGASAPARRAGRWSRSFDTAGITSSGPSARTTQKVERT